MCACISFVQLFVTLWTVARQPPLSVGFPGKNAKMGCHILLHRIFQPRIKLVSPVSPALGRFLTTVLPGKPIGLDTYLNKMT